MSSSVNAQVALSVLMKSGRRVHSALDAFDAAVASTLGVHRSDLRCLNLLEQGGVSPKSIGEKLRISSGAVTALIDRLEQVGFVQRVPASSDRRSVLVEMSPLPYQRTAHIYRRSATLLGESFAHFDAQALDQAAVVLSIFAQSFESAVEELSTPEPPKLTSR